MKIKYITLTLTLLFSLYIPTKAQNNEGGFWNGIEGTLNNIFNDAIQGTEAGRLFMLFNSDISMIMKAHNDAEINMLTYGDEMGPMPFAWLYTSSDASDASMTAEFDWDNKALSMHLKETATKNEVGWSAPVVGSGMDVKTNEATDQYQYTDKYGYWYVPHKSGYVKFNAKKAAQGVAAELSKVDLDNLSKKMYAAIIELLAQLDDNFAVVLYDLLMNFGDKIDKTVKSAESAKDGINKILNSGYLSIVGFPVFIHWALLYSPDYIKARHSVTETTVTYSGIPNCTKLTVPSGKEKGKFMIFDQYNRLVYIDSKKDGSVQFFYGKDLTVKLPAAKTMSQVINESIKASKENN